MKTISILGSTGSIGTQTLDVIRANKEDFQVFGLSANQNIDLLVQQIFEFTPKIVSLYDESKLNELRIKIRKLNLDYNIEIYTKLNGLINIANSSENDILVTSVVGMIGLLPTLEAIKKGKTIALANKETLVTAGELVINEAKKFKANIIPVDSEHSAIFQCLQGEDEETINKLILTASGGPFRGKSKDFIKQANKNDALKHPNWTMGKKITIDSATLMNKGLEVIEARWLFNIKHNNIEVLIHPQSIIHSMVEFTDLSVKAQLGNPNMKGPIQYALGYPIRLKSTDDRLDLLKHNKLTFEEPDLNSFPCLKLAYEALKNEGTYLSALNAANEVLVYKFLNDEIGFYDISNLIYEVLENHNSVTNPNLDEILEADNWARNYIKSRLLNK